MEALGLEMTAQRVYFFFLCHCCLAAQTFAPGNLVGSTIGREQINLARKTPSGGAQVVYCEQYPSLQACHNALPAAGGMMTLPPNSVFWLAGTLNITKNN